MCCNGVQCILIWHDLWWKDPDQGPHCASDRDVSASALDLTGWRAARERLHPIAYRHLSLKPIAALRHSLDQTVRLIAERSTDLLDALSDTVVRNKKTRPN